MFRQSFARLSKSFGQQRKLFLLVFLWTCLCLLILRSSLIQREHEIGSEDVELESSARLISARSANSWLPIITVSQSSAAPLYLAPEFALPDNSINNYYSLSSISSGHKSAVETRNSDEKEEEQQHSEHVKTKISSSVAQQPAKLAAAAASTKSATVNSEHNFAGSNCLYNYPNLFDLQFNNIHWQKMSGKQLSGPTNTTATYYLYNAYYDDRWRQGVPSVRILAMIDRVAPPPTNCLFWHSSLRRHKSGKEEKVKTSPLRPLITRANFVYAWYPKWGNYKDGLLQPWIVTCPMPRAHLGLVPESVSLVEAPTERPTGEGGRNKRDIGQREASIAMPASFSSSSSPSQVSAIADSVGRQTSAANERPLERSRAAEYDCKQVLPITNNLPVFNQRPAVKKKFAVCVKGLDFPHEDVSVRLVEWIELLNLLGASKIFLYNLDVHENISKVLHYYEQRGMVELSPLTLPGDQPNLPEYQHLYLKSKLTAKRQNELIPYNDCLYRNLNSYEYLALLDIDEIIMPLKHHNWFGLMQEVESASMAEFNYSRASYNVRNVYFFDDLAGPLGTTSTSSSSSSSSSSSDLNPDEGEDGDDQVDEEAKVSSRQVAEADSLERGIPHYLHMMQHVYRSKNYTKPGQYVKCFHNTERVVSLHNHFPMNCFGQCTTYSVPVQLAHLQHYRKDCVGPLKQSCKSDFRVFTTRDTTIWKYKQQMIRRTTRVLNHLNLLSNPSYG